jgi:hypothetical protein
VTWVFELVVRHDVGSRRTLSRRAKEREHTRGGEKVFHQGGGQFDKAGRAARAGHTLVFGATDHG